MSIATNAPAQEPARALCKMQKPKAMQMARNERSPSQTMNARDMATSADQSFDLHRTEARTSQLTFIAKNNRKGLCKAGVLRRSQWPAALQKRRRTVQTLSLKWPGNLHSKAKWRQKRGERNGLRAHDSEAAAANRTAKKSHTNGCVTHQPQSSPMV